MSSEVLIDAWNQLAEYDLNANKQRGVYFALQTWILVLGFTATLLAVTDTALRPLYSAQTLWIHEIFRFAIVAVPAIAAILVGALSVLKPGVRWVQLRAGAETIKREIYRYRTGVGLYQKPAEADTNLANAVNITSDTVEQGDLENFALEPYPYEEGSDKYPLIPKYAAHKDDDGLSTLTGDEYATLRLGDQLRYFSRAAAKLGVRRIVLQLLTVVLGGAGSLIAAFNLANWVPVTTALGAAFASYLQYMKIEDTLVKYNRARHSLRKVERWWSSLDPSTREEFANVDHLVRATEGILAAEMTDWARQMAEAVQKVPKAQEAEAKDEDDDDKRSKRRSQGTGDRGSQSRGSAPSDASGATEPHAIAVVPDIAAPATFPSETAPRPQTTA